MQTKIIGGGVGTPGVGQEMAVDPTFLAARVALRPLDYAGLGQVLGLSRASAVTGTTVSVGGGGILFENQQWTLASASAVGEPSPLRMRVFG